MLNKLIILANSKTIYKGSKNLRIGSKCFFLSFLFSITLNSDSLSMPMLEASLAFMSRMLLGFAENSKKGTLSTGIYNAPFHVLSTDTDNLLVPKVALLIAIVIGLVSGAPGGKAFSDETLL